MAGRNIYLINLGSITCMQHLIQTMVCSQSKFAILSSIKSTISFKNLQHDKGTIYIYIYFLQNSAKTLK